jgi:hypothetical protein
LADTTNFVVFVVRIRLRSATIRLLRRDSNVSGNDDEGEGDTDRNA